ncbi:ABC transporter, permease protein [[Clostridium] methylpentosum DSM 5476]|uniref:ABC transporter, permease protein n=1 Tax=[Clostridium] methylpentosum DSM 5476 TaxID=537013 RepID=C0EHY1_9FIRM|nr:ABC transporter, permease protein [[Clostridium] methylpentosum DSM 5476]MDY3988612.1 amino acid ABC transporter permease [Massilioclostridium sp.]MEE1492923.1 amino acid ABC transporter permease [Massilioclostridium sp.]
MDFEFIARHAGQFVQAAGLTLNLAFWGILLSLLIGLMCSLLIYFRVRVFSRVAKIYIELSRNTPLLIQLFFLFYGLPKIGVMISAQACAVIGLSFLGGSYMAESFRSGFEAVGKTQLEAGMSIGLTRRQLTRYIILPQAFSVSIPSLTANAIFLLKETSIFSAIALADLMFVAKDLIGMYYKTFEALSMLVASYLIILLPLSILLRWVERRVRYAEFGHTSAV